MRLTASIRSIADALVFVLVLGLIIAAYLSRSQ